MEQQGAAVVVGDYSGYTCLRVDKSQGGGVAEVVLARPKALNTMTAAFFDEIGRVFRALDRDPEVNAILVWAEGRMFTAGLDLKAAASSFSPGTSLPFHI
jgi:enoyl-CoA hydratase